VLNEVSSYWGGSVVGGGTLGVGVAMYGWKRGHLWMRGHIKYRGTQTRQIRRGIPIITPTVIPVCLPAGDAV